MCLPSVYEDHNHLNLHTNMHECVRACLIVLALDLKYDSIRNSVINVF